MRRIGREAQARAHSRQDAATHAADHAKEAQAKHGDTVLATGPTNSVPEQVELRAGKNVAATVESEPDRYFADTLDSKPRLITSAYACIPYSKDRANEPHFCPALARGNACPGMRIDLSAKGPYTPIGEADSGQVHLDREPGKRLV